MGLPTYVSHVRQAIIHAMSNMEGNSDVLPGLCLSQGISSILPIIVGAIRNGTSDEKEEALETLRHAIMLSCQQALQQNIYPITGPLLWLLLERMATSVHMIALKTLLLLLIKVSYGSFFDNIQNKTFIGSVWFPKVCQKLPIHSHFIKKKLRHNENRGVLLHRCCLRFFTATSLNTSPSYFSFSSSPFSVFWNLRFFHFIFTARKLQRFFATVGIYISLVIERRFCQRCEDKCSRRLGSCDQGTQKRRWHFHFSSWPCCWNNWPIY